LSRELTAQDGFQAILGSLSGERSHDQEQTGWSLCQIQCLGVYDYRGRLDWPTHCPVLPWIELHYPGRYRNDPAGASLDRIDHQKGYVPGDVRVISLRANLLRKNITPEGARYRRCHDGRLRARAPILPWPLNGSPSRYRAIGERPVAEDRRGRLANQSAGFCSSSAMGSMKALSQNCFHGRVIPKI
jgi:hypothetical protein